MNDVEWLEAAKERQRWFTWISAELLDGVGTLPRYGSAEWLALPWDDPRRIVAALRAGELWASDGDDLTFAAAAVEAREPLEGEPMVYDEEWAEFTRSIVKGVQVADQALQARAASGDRRALAQLDKIKDTSWLREESVYHRIMRERNERGE